MGGSFLKCEKRFSLDDHHHSDGFKTHRYEKTTKMV